ncbi:hypothetical protein D9758_007133 [Tetrapyrgos nigripes]|uniref:Uncharacterized protein n=1 Tax=Tetrapyrgos nigripes TaxID=182062 RepID=A0A8H5LMT1_9AGAR|nr:hypothetical protein D9758_007133 [Tetrapyrgos nigripes]
MAGCSVTSNWPQDENRTIYEAILDRSAFLSISDTDPLIFVRPGFDQEIQTALIQKYLPHRAHLPYSPQQETSCIHTLWIALLAQWTELLREPNTSLADSVLWAGWDAFETRYLYPEEEEQTYVYFEVDLDQLTQLRFAQSMSKICEAIIMSTADDDDAGPGRPSRDGLLGVYFRTLSMFLGY